MWIVQNDELTNTKFIENIDVDFVVPPFPELLWRVKNSRLTHGFLPDEIPENTVNKPFPKLLWRVENSDLTHEFLPKNPGAFENAMNLRKIIIPESVVQIGAKSFSGTLLKSVQVAENCRYSATSFPEDCVINFYK